MQENVKHGSIADKAVMRDHSKCNSKCTVSNNGKSPITSLDGGYGWIIVFASFCSNVIVDGIIFTTGESLVAVWEKDFNTTTTQASIAQSLLSGFYLLSGPLASALANLFGCRLVAIVGALTTFIGFVSSSFVPSLLMLYTTFGVIGGIGFGLVYLPSIVIVNQYFEKRRALAMGIAVCGSGIGTTIFSQVFPFLLRYCDGNWRSFLLYVAFFNLLLILCGLCYRKLPSATFRDDEAEKSALIVFETKPSADEEVIQVNEIVKVPKPEANDTESLKRKWAVDRTVNLNLSRMFHSKLDLRFKVDQERKTKSDFDLSKIFDKGIDWYQGLPLRPDIYYPGSMSSLQERISRRGTPKARCSLMMTSITTTKIIPQQIKRRPSLSHILRSMIDTSLLSNCSFILIAVTGFMTLFCLFVPFIYLGKQAAMKVNATPRQQSYLVMSLGIANILGRILCGLISDLPKMDPLVVHNVAIIIGGLATCTVPLLTEYWMYLLYTLPFAFGVACFSALRSIICVELLGLEKLSSAFGMMMLCMGVAALIGPPTAAFLKDLSGNFDLSFYLMGILLTLSGVLCIPLRRCNNSELLKSTLSSPPLPTVTQSDGTNKLEMKSTIKTERF